MDNKEMEKLYKHFGKKKDDKQEMPSIANIFHEMGKGADEHKQRDSKGSTREV